MIESFLNKAVELGADRIEIEYQDGAELVTAFHGLLGGGIGWVDAAHREALFNEIRDAKKKRKITIGGRTYRLRFFEYESFGEWVHVIKIR